MDAFEQLTSSYSTLATVAVPDMVVKGDWGDLKRNKPQTQQEGVV